MNLSEDQILALAPDEASKKAGRDLSGPSKWVSKGANEQALWGECQGSGSKPYQTQIDLAGMTFKCSCPSRKFPCKHGLGLLLFQAKQPVLFTEKEAPAWVAEWLKKKQEKTEKKPEGASQPVDEAAQFKRQQAREKGVADGIEELLRWMKDIVRNGILPIPEKGPAFFSAMAKRMIDAKAPGLAGMVKNLGNTDFFIEGWQSTFMDQLARIYLVISGFKNKDNISPSLKEDVRNWIGFTQNQDELKEKNGITDTWLVLGKQVTEDDNLATERNWLYGTQSGQYALVLQFSVPGQGTNFSLTPGMVLQAELVFFPSAEPMRAIIKRQLSTGNQARVTGLSSWLKVAESATNSNVRVPFTQERPYIIQQLKPVQYNSQWWLADRENRLVQLKSGYQNLYTLLSVSGGKALDMVVFGKENLYEPMGIWEGENYIVI
ncbi:MAG: SWIM zinc finger family protein [Ferruginibacter sp.]